MTTTAPATLSVDGDGGTLRLRLDVPERDLGEPLQREFRQPLDAATLAALVARADGLLRGPERADLADEARARGGVLYRTLVPAGLREELRHLGDPLVVSTGLPGVPWELLHDGESFWGLRYALGRRLVLERPVRTAPRRPARGRPRALVIGADPRGDLPFVAREVAQACEALEPLADVDAMAGQLATFDAVVAALGRGYDLVHWCGHVVGEGDAAALLLDGEARLPGAVIEANLAGRPLVFLNGCASARCAGTPAGTVEAVLTSAAHAFLLGGALGVVGTLADVTDRHAAALAEAFYRGVLAGRSTGEALRAARAALAADPETACSPVWLSVVLYGNPSQHVVRGAASALALVPSAAAPVPAADASGAPDAPTVGTPPAASPRSASPAAAAARSRRRIAVAALVLLALGLAAGIARRLQAPAGGPVVVGVMAVRSRGAGAPAWMRDLTRDALNTVLSRVPAVRVYSRQKIDFLRERRALSEIEAAEALGMSKMLAATVEVERGQVVLGLEVIDIASGLLETSERVQGPESDLIALQTELALRALDALGVRPSEADLRAIVSSRQSETLDAYRLLTDTLGEPPAGPPQEQPPRTGPRQPGPTSFGVGWESTAWAQPADPDEVAIRDLLARYAKALETKEPERLAALQLEMSEAQRTSLIRYFAIAGGLRVRVTNVDVLVDDDEAIATFTREDEFVDAPSGRTMRLAVRVSGLLTKRPEGWRIRSLREPS